MMARVPGCSDMPSGSVTRRILRVSPSGSISTAATTGWPVSTRPSLPVKQTCLALASCPLRQNLVQGENTSCGCSPCCCCCAGGAACACGVGAGGALGCALGAAFGGGAFGAEGAG